MTPLLTFRGELFQFRENLHGARHTPTLFPQFIFSLFIFKNDLEQIVKILLPFYHFFLQKDITIPDIRNKTQNSLDPPVARPQGNTVIMYSQRQKYHNR